MVVISKRAQAYRVEGEYAVTQHYIIHRLIPSFVQGITVFKCVGFPKETHRSTRHMSLGTGSALKACHA